MKRTRPRPMPLCECGCGAKVLRRTRRYLAGHVPPAIRAFGGQKGGRRRAWARRMRVFAETFETMTRQGRTVTKEAILDAFADVYRRAYNAGYQAGEYSAGFRRKERRAA